MMGRWVTLLMVLLSITASARAEATTQTSNPSNQPAVVISLHGEIDDFSRDTLYRHFASAKSLGAKTIILDINTYGGTVTAGLDISRFLKRQDVHVIAFVNDKAISAGAMIAMACDEIVMVPGSVIGDCAPISVTEGGKLNPLPVAERAKFESPILADFYDSAIRNHHDTLVSQAMVAVGRTVYYVEKDAARKFVDAEEYAKLTKDGWKDVAEVPTPLDKPDSLLTVHADLASKIGLASVVSSDHALASARNDHIVARFEQSTGEYVIAFLNSPVVRSLLITIFMMSLYAAFSIPGHGAPEAIAVVSLGLLLGVPLLSGYAQWYEIIAILAGLALIAFEIFVFPGHFVSAVVGALLMIGGFIMTFVPKEPTGMPGFLPSLTGTYTALRTGALVVVAGLACSFFLWIWLNRYLPKLPYLNRLILTTTSPTPAADASDISPAVSTEWPIIGMKGTALTDLRPGGSALFPDPETGDTRIADVVSESGYVPAKSTVVVRELRGSYAVVRAAEKVA